MFRGRYHSRVLRGHKEVRDALRYVLNNARKHGVMPKGWKMDPYSSGIWFDRWSGTRQMFPRDGGPIACPTALPQDTPR